MEIKRSSSQPSVEGPADWFTGVVRIDPLLTRDRPITRHRTIRLANLARFVLPLYVVVEISSLGWRGHQRLVHRLRYVEIAGDRPALELYLKHVRDGVVSDRFQTR
jgi:hypothetical protein